MSRLPFYGIMGDTNVVIHLYCYVSTELSKPKNDLRYQPAVKVNLRDQLTPEALLFFAGKGIVDGTIIGVDKGHDRGSVRERSRGCGFCFFYFAGDILRELLIFVVGVGAVDVGSGDPAEALLQGWHIGCAGAGLSVLNLNGLHMVVQVGG